MPANETIGIYLCCRYLIALKMMMYTLMKRYSIVLYCALLTLLLPSCNSSNQIHSITANGTATAEGPFFEGPNTFQAAILLTEAENWDKSWTLEALKKGSAQSLTVNLPDSITTDDYNSVSVQVLAKDLPMLSLGALSKLPEHASSLQIELSNEADLTSYLKTGSITLILDIDFKNEDYTEQLNIPVALTLNVEL